MNHLGDVCEIADAVVDEIDLSVARHLKVDGIGNDLRTESVDFRLDGIAVGRWCLDDAEVAGTDERELQRARYRCCRHRKGVDVGLHLAQLLLRRDTELLFFVDDKQPEVLELHRFADELMRTYYNINLSFRQIFQQS